MTWRAELTRRSVRPLQLLSALPRWLIFFAVVGVLVVGLLASGVLGALALLLLAGFLGWLLVLSWPALDAPSRLLRVAVVAALLGLAVTRW